MKKKLTELTTLERHWVLAEVLGKQTIEYSSGYIFVDNTAHVEAWNPDQDKALMWDLSKEVGKTVCDADGYLNKDFYSIKDFKLEAKTEEEAIQLIYIYCKLGTDEVEVPEMGE